MPQNYQNPDRAFQENVQQPASSSLVPSVQPSTPSVPGATAPAGYNANAALQVPTNTTVNVTTAPPPEQAKPKTDTPTQAANALTMPATGSVVDLLNSAGQDSSYAARQQLAQQYGIQNYSGTAAQNQELSKKYLEAFNGLKGTAVPQNPAEARNALATYQTEQTQTPSQVNPTQQFMDIYGSMNPVEANIFQQLSGLLSTSSNKQSLSELYAQETAAQGLPALNMELADINRVMSGTEDDLRAEITNAGGFATESQVQALAGARNKTLLKQAQYLSDIINSKNDYVDRIVSLTQADREQVSKDLDQKLGIAQTLVTMSNNMENAARSNYQSIIDSVGWEGLAQSVQGNASQTEKIEKTFGLAPGELQALASYKKPLNQMEQLELENQQLQNQKLRQDLNTGPSVSTQVVDVGGKKVLINSKTGQVISDITSNFTPETGTQLAQAQQTITDTDALLKNPGMASVVGPNPLARIPVISGFTGSASNFIAGVEQLRGQLTLQNLQNAKANGATFGALSDSELALLSSSASKLGTWAIKDKAGNVTGYSASEADFKKELDKINNFSKLDYILKGGSPTSVGVQEMADGTFWVKNSDGSFVKL